MYCVFLNIPFYHAYVLIVAVFSLSVFHGILMVYMGRYYSFMPYIERMCIHASVCGGRQEHRGVE